MSGRLPDDGPPGPSHWTHIPERDASGDDSTAVVVAAAVLLTFGVPVTFGALVALLATTLVESLVPPGTEIAMLRDVARLSAAAFGLVGVLQVAAALAILRRRPWGRALGSLIAVAWIVLGIILALTSIDSRTTPSGRAASADTMDGVAMAVAMIAVHAGVVVVLVRGGRHFTPRTGT
jgi:hypothetical protein